MKKIEKSFKKKKRNKLYLVYSLTLVLTTKLFESRAKIFPD